MKDKLIIILIVFSCGFGLNSFSQPTSTTGTNKDTPRDGIFDHIHTEFKKPIPYSPLREADVIYSKRIWQVIDFREKINQTFYYPVVDHLNWKSFMSVIITAVKSSELTAYNAEVGDEFTVPFNASEVTDALAGVARVTIRRNMNGDSIGVETVYDDAYSPGDVKKLRIKEVWYFDKQRSEMNVRILGFCPVREYIEEVDGFVQVKTTPLFWIYFPEARSVLSRAEVFNRNNGAERRTYDDIFWKRMFSSYIYKEENVYDRQINQYATGMEALFESERIKNEIFTIENDMWDY